MPLTNEMKNKVIGLSKPYPKRGSSKEIVAVEYHSTEPGENPRDSLQLKEATNGKT
jgi:hypothetical protein